MGWPQITLIVLLAISVGVSAAKHGQPLEYQTYNVCRTLVRVVILSTLLHFGGFFTNP